MQIQDCILMLYTCTYFKKQHLTFKKEVNERTPERFLVLTEF